MLTPKTGVDLGHDTPDSRIRRVRKMSKSMDSLRKLIPKDVLSNTSVTHHSDWAEISSSTTSLENTTNNQADDCSLGLLDFHSFVLC